MVNKFARVTGGADTHCLQLADGLRTRGHDVEFLATADPSNFESRGEFIPLKVSTATRDNVGRREAVGVASHALWNPDAARATRTVITRFRPQVAHLHKLYVQLSVAPVVVAARHGVALVQTAHDYEFVSAAAADATGFWRDRIESEAQYKLLNTLTYAVRRRVHRPRIAAWIAVSRASAAVYAQHGITATPLPNFTVTFGVPRNLPTFEHRRGILYIGRLVEEKGVLHVLELASLLPHLLVEVAGHGPLESLVREAARSRSNLDYLGNLPPSAVATQLRKARLVVMPALWQEPGPLSALEAMANGVPIIAYANGGLAEYVSDAGAGLVIRADPHTLATATSELYHNRLRWEELAKRGPRAVQSRHSLDRYLDGIEEVYSRVTRSSPAW